MVGFAFCCLKILKEILKGQEANLVGRNLILLKGGGGVDQNRAGLGPGSPSVDCLIGLKWSLSSKQQEKLVQFVF